MKPLVEKTFAAVGCPHDEAQRIAHYLIHANLTGHDSHGVLRVPRYVEWVKNGRVKAGQQVEVVMDAGAMAILDGHQGFGQTVGPQAAQHGITKALEHGVAVVALRNAGHLGRIGDYAEAAAAAGLASIHCVNVRGSLLVAPFGGVERRLSTAPFAAGVPVPGGEPVILDFATSAVAEGKALVAARGGKPLPMGTLITAEGELSNDPLELYGEITEGVSPNPRSGSGALRTMGDHKGSGLSIMMELLGGALTGCGTAGPPPKEFANGMLSVYMEVARFDDLGNYADEVRNYIDFVKNSRPADPQAPVLVPGDKERALKRERESNGLPLSVQSWDDIVGAARAASVTDAEISELINQI
ncbi:MAG: malate/lactate/ureidoglycolate dehydrogenase [Chromatiales bacterium]|nr:malate/lactate/ureidoglycolate dehydrogenase [Chromatiales bacterium]